MKTLMLKFRIFTGDVGPPSLEGENDLVDALMRWEFEWKEQRWKGVCSGTCARCAG